MVDRKILKNNEGVEQAEYDYHLPVLLNESIEGLFNTDIYNESIDNSHAVFIDGTLGGGGHAAIILQRLKKFGGTLFAFDKDKSAITRAAQVYEEDITRTPFPRMVLFNTSFTKACSICNNRGIKPLGIILDLGVSSMQLDSEQCGISYRYDSPLDMRFDGNSGESANNRTAKEILNTYTEEELTGIFRKYGEEPRSRVIARRLVESRRVETLQTTFQLRHIIEGCVPKLDHFKSLSRIFQAIRIEVNQELTELENTLRNSVDTLAKGGRIVVISYHSLEDRIVKNIFNDFSFSPKVNKYKHIAEQTRNDKRNINEQTDNVQAIIVPKLKLYNKKPIFPSSNEIARNSRARSAKLRIAEII